MYLEALGPQLLPTGFKLAAGGQLPVNCIEDRERIDVHSYLELHAFERCTDIFAQNRWHSKVLDQHIKEVDDLFDMKTKESNAPKDTWKCAPLLLNVSIDTKI